jgi:N-acetylglutamate synthase-like GNAT family acetyltransferase
MKVRRINSIEDIIGIYNGIKDGMRMRSFTDFQLMETMEIIMDHKTTFYIFEENNEYVGFGAVKDGNEVHKVYVMPNRRGEGYGTKISLWIKGRILKSGFVPICWVKNTNKWNNAMKSMGMVKIDDGYMDTNKYMLRDFKAYTTAVEAYGIKDIQCDLTKEEQWKTPFRFRGGN